MAEIADDTTTKATLDTRDAEAGTFSGLLENIGDHDFVRVSLDAGVAYQFYLSLLETGSLTDGDAFLAIRDSQGNIVTTIDDGGVGTNAFLLFVAPSSGTYFLDISAAGDTVTGQYSLVSAVAAGSTNFFKTDGDDIVSTVSPGERTIGGKGADAIILATDGLDALGEQGNDTLTGNNSINELFGGLGNDIINGLG